MKTGGDFYSHGYTYSGRVASAVALRNIGLWA
jgi:adenosylmethionine-8-amino-7-oxononanoate aminotransferase